MATIKNTVTLQDKMTPVLRSVIKALNSTVIAMAKVDGVSDSAFNAMKRDVQAATAAVDKMDRELREVGTIAEQSAQKFTQFKNPLVSLASGLYSVQAVMQGIGKITGLADQMSSTTARLGLMNDGLQTTEQLQNMILASTNASRSSYTDTAAVVSKLGILAGDSFKNNQEMVLFAEQMNKQFKIGGASVQEQTSAMYQLTQAMASGALQGDEFRAIRENAPLLAKAIADYTGKSIGELKEMGAQGLITSDIIKAAMFNAMDDTNSKFAELPMTFGQAMTLIQNKLITSLQPTLAWLSQGAAFLANNWEKLIPVFLGVAGALAAYAAGLGLVAVWHWIATGAAQAFFTTLMANPLFWIALVIGVLIMVIYKWIQSVGGIQVAWLIAVNVIMTAWEWLKIAFFTGVYWVLDLWGKMTIGLYSASVAIQNFMGDMKANVLMILQNMVNGAIKIINDFIGLLNKIPGVSIDAVSQVTFGATAMAENNAAKNARASDLDAMKAEIAANAASRDASLASMKASAAASESAREMAIGAAKVEAAAKGAADSQTFGLEDMGMPAGIGEVGKVGEVGKIKGEVNISDDDIKLLKDVAAVEFINKYTTMTPNMTVTFGDVKETADVNKILSTIEDMIEEAYASSLVGEGI